MHWMNRASLTEMPIQSAKWWMSTNHLLGTIVLIRRAISSRRQGLQSNCVCFQMIRSTLEKSGWPEVVMRLDYWIHRLCGKCLSINFKVRAQLNTGICQIDIVINRQWQPNPHKSILDIILNGKVRVGLSLDRSFMTEPSSKTVLFRILTSKISMKNQLHERIEDTRLI